MVSSAEAEKAASTTTTDDGSATTTATATTFMADEPESLESLAQARITGSRPRGYIPCVGRIRSASLAHCERVTVVQHNTDPQAKIARACADIEFGVTSGAFEFTIINNDAVESFKKLQRSVEFAFT